MALGARTGRGHAGCTPEGRHSRRVAQSLLSGLRGERGEQKKEKLNE